MGLEEQSDSLEPKVEQPTNEQTAPSKVANVELTVEDPIEQSSCEVSDANPDQESNSPDEDLAKVLSRWYRQTSFWSTKIIIGLNVLVFVVMSLTNANAVMHPPVDLMIQFGADFGPLTLNGEVWRILTCTFLHFGIIHLAVNMLALRDLGEASERLFGTPRFLLLYILAGLGGSVASLLWHPYVVSAGASGAIFGVYGSIYAFYLSHSKDIDQASLLKASKSAGTFLVYNLLFGAIANFDNAAHIGGLITGFALGYFYVPEDKRSSVGEAVVTPSLHSSMRNPAIGTICMLALMVVVFLWSLSAPFDFSKRLLFVRGFKAFEARKYEDAEKDLKEFVVAQPKDAKGHFLYGLLLRTIGRTEEALPQFSEAILCDEKMPEPLVARVTQNMTWCRFDKVVPDVEKAFQLIDWREKQALYTVLWGALSSKICGDADKASEMETIGLGRCKFKDWPFPILEYINGRLTADQLMAKVNDVDRATEARTYICLNQMHGNVLSADMRKQLQWVVDHGNKEFVEYEIASNLLKRNGVTR